MIRPLSLSAALVLSSAGTALADPCEAPLPKSGTTLIFGRECYFPLDDVMVLLARAAPHTEWEADALPSYAVLDGARQVVAGGFDSADDAIRAAKRCEDAYEVEARRVSRRRVWCLFDEAGQ